MMSDIQIYDLTVDDIISYPVWYFPMDETVEDECTIRPVPEDSYDSMQEQIIIRTKFTLANNQNFFGYIYWSPEHTMDYLQPAVFIDDSCITFWEGMEKPTWEGYALDLSKLKKLFPIQFKSQDFPDAKSISGVIEGLYYIDEKNNVLCLKP